MQDDRRIDGGYTAIDKAVKDKAGATVSFRTALAMAVAAALPVAIGVLVLGPAA